MSFMKYLSSCIVLILMLLAPPNVSAAFLSADESEILVNDIERVFSRFNQGDPEPFILSSHPLVYQYAGGQEAFENQARKAIQAFKDGHMRLTTEDIGAPTELIVVEGGEVCFVPRTVRLKSNNRQARQTTFVVAIRDVSSQWRYVDGSPFRTNPELLFTMLPFLSKDVVLPPNTIEVLE